MKQLISGFLLSIIIIYAQATSSIDNIDCITCTPCTVDCTTACIDTRSCKQCHTLYLPRSQHSNSAYFATPWDEHVSIGIEYQHSFRGSDIAHCLFGTDLLDFQGSQLPVRDTNALIADYFGLSPFFNGTIRFAPAITNINLHLTGRYDIDPCPGLYLEIFATVSHQRRALFDEGACDFTCTGTRQVIPFPVGYMAQEETVTPAPNIITALSGNFTFGDMATPWKFGKIGTSTLHKTAVAGVTGIVGYDLFNDECGQIGLFLLYSAPTGGRANPKKLFSPIIGNGGYHEIGGGISVYSPVWRDEDNDRSISFYLYGNVSTLLTRTQIRSFDFKNKGCLSRYMLLKKLVPPTALEEQIFTALQDSHGPGFSYGRSLINGINFTTQSVDSKISVKGDACLRLLYQHDCFDVAVGYNIYGHAQETIHFTCEKPCGIRSDETYGFKGCTGAYTYAYATANSGTTVSTALPALNSPLNATSSDATITSCGTVDGSTTNGLQMLVGNGTNNFVGIDWSTGINGPQVNAVPVGTALSSVQITHLSNPARAISIKDLDRCSGAAPSQISHKGFITIAYCWHHCPHELFVEGAFEAEGSGGCCHYKQWGFWLKGGIIF